MKKNQCKVAVLAVALVALLAVLTAALWQYDTLLGGIAAAALLAISVAAIVLFVDFRRRAARCIRDFSRTLTAEREALEAFPMPALLTDERGEIVFYNDLFSAQVLDGVEAVGRTTEEIFPNLNERELARRSTLDVQVGAHRLTAYISPTDGGYAVYFSDNTVLKNVAAEYTASRPVVLLICIDNLEEATEKLRDGTRVRIAGQIETLLEDWITASGGILQKYGSDRFVAVTENRHLADMTKTRFAILDTVRNAFSETEGGITLSIGVGQGKTMQECHSMARHALDMALSRGGDQAALKTANGFDFYGGVSRGVERRTKVRTRVIANALSDLIRSSDRVLVMGHRLSDLDCVGSGLALTSAVRRLGVTAHAVIRRQTSMANELISRFEAAGQTDLCVEPEQALEWIGENTLLIITDVHTAALLDSPAVYEAARRVVVIDHHRKMVNHIQDAVLTYHEPSSSSACELVTELVQYMGVGIIGRLEAEALLSGMMLDTRSFVLRTGVRTFEAAAYLRRLGADTVSVKKMFSESMELYRRKSELMSRTVVYKEMAIAVANEDFSDMRAAAAQAADELLSVQGVVASFVICRMGREVNVSARSYGDCNVQVLMEALGGGGHLTMAGAQVVGQTVFEVEKRLKEIIAESKK